MLKNGKPETAEDFISLMEDKISTLAPTSDLNALSSVLKTLKHVVRSVETDLAQHAAQFAEDRLEAHMEKE